MNYKFEAIFKSNNKTLKMNADTDIKIINIKGIESSSYSINTVDSEHDGAGISSKKIEPREITITGDIEKNQNEDINRDFLLRFFDPKSTGELIITRNNISRKIQYEVSSFDFATNVMAKDIDFTIDLDCLQDPYFSDAKNAGGMLTQITPQFTFPLVINPTKIMGYKTYKPYIPLLNTGDKETGLEIIVTAKRGKADGVKLILNNNEFIKVNQTLELGDVLKINTNPRQKAITLNGTNIINKIDRNSTFFSLHKGKNVLKYECDNGSTNVDIDVQFFRKYLGV